MGTPVGSFQKKKVRELLIRIAEACNAAEELEETFFHDLLRSSRRLQNQMKQTRSVLQCSVSHLRKEDISSKESLAMSINRDIQVFTNLQQYLFNIEESDKTFRTKNHKKEIVKLQDKLTDILAILKEIIPVKDQMETALDIPSFSSRAMRRQYDYKVVSDSVQVLLEMKNKVQELHTIFIIFGRS